MLYLFTLSYTLIVFFSVFGPVSVEASTESDCMRVEAPWGVDGVLREA